MITSYLKIALRNLRRQPGYALINVIGLALGIASSLLIALFVADEFRYDRFHADGDRIYRTAITYTHANGSQTAIPMMPYRLAPALETAFPEIEEIVRINPWRALVGAGEKQTLELDIAFVDPGFFELFSFDLTGGNPATVLDQPYTVVLSESAARKYFGESNPVGATLPMRFLNGMRGDWTVSGVMADMPRHSHFKFDMLLSMTSAEQVFNNRVLQNWGEGSSYTYLRLPEGSDPAALTARFPEFGTAIINENFPDYADMYLQRLTDIHLHSRLRGELEPNGDIRYVLIFALVAVFLLVIAAINYMNLATARSIRRAREVGLRKVMGAVRSQLVVQFIGEALLITAMAFGVALLLARLYLPWFNALSGKDLTVDPAGNAPLLAVIGGILLLVGIVAGSYPAIFLSAYRPVAVLKGRVHSRRSGVGMRRGLVVLQFAISIALIIITAVVYRQVEFMQTRKLGLDPKQVVVIPLPNTAVYPAFRNAALASPHVRGVTASSKRLTHRLSSTLDYRAEGIDPASPRSIKVVAVDFAFFETLDIPIVAGRSFSRDYGGDARDGIILNRSAVEEIGWAEPIGKWFETATLDGDGNWVPKRGIVVGVAEDIHFESLHREIQPMVYFISDTWLRWMAVELDGRHIPEAAAHLESAWRETVPGFPYQMDFLEADIQALYDAERRFLTLFLTFAALAIAIACLGIFGLASFTAEQRTREIGIRKTLGATTSGIVVMLSSDFLRLVLAANLIAWPVAWYFMSDWLADYPYTAGLGWGVFIAGGLTALAIALLSVIFQALRAALTNPVSALRHE